MLNSSIIGSRETALDTPKQYYKLCNQKPKEILSGIVEKRPGFKKEEYITILKLFHSTDPHSTF